MDNQIDRFLNKSYLGTINELETGNNNVPSTNAEI